MAGNKKYDITIIGSGFSGSLLAIIAAKLGRSVLLLEKQSHPRFAIGESTTPLTNLYLEQLADRYSLDDIRPLSKWGSWQSSKKELAVGLKRGFSFFHHQQGKPFETDTDHANQLLVAASPHDRIADTHWYRSGFDAYLARCAVNEGAELIENIRLSEMKPLEKSVRLGGFHNGDRLNIETGTVIDASGPRGFIFKSMNLADTPVETMPVTCGLYNHFRNVKRMDRVTDYFDNGPPYPVDDAAIHHVFDEGWMWVLRFNNGIVSAGLSVKESFARELHLGEGEKAWKRFLDLFPTIGEQFRNADPLFGFSHLPRLSFRSNRIYGRRWVLLPSAYGFIDPLLSMGFPLTLRGVMRISRIFEETSPGADLTPYFEHYADDTRKESDLAALMIGGMYARLNDFEMFSALSLLYFAAASFSETAIRLGKPDLAGSFLLGDRPVFGKEMRRCFTMARQELDKRDRKHLLEKIFKTIEPVDIAGFGDLSRHHWYPVNMTDLTDNADKLNTDPDDAIRKLRELGF